MFFYNIFYSKLCGKFMDGMLKDDFHIATYEDKLKKLLDAFVYNENLNFILNVFENDSLIKIHEIGKALYLLISFKCCPYKSYDALDINFTKKRTVCLFARANFIWGALPYPAEQAELGSLLLQLSIYNSKYKEIALDMLDFQQASLTHKCEVFSSLFVQSISRNFDDINRASHIFLSKMNVSYLEDYFFIDEEIGFMMLRNKESSAYITGSGCKSSLGAFLFKDVGIVALGPHQGVPESGEEFGISGKAHYFQFFQNEKSTNIAFSSSLSSISKRNTNFQFLKDSSFSFSKVNICAEISLLKYFIDIEFVNCSKENSFFSLFCKAHTCSIFKGPCLRAYSLDSYKGPVNDVILRGLNGESIIIELFGGSKNLQIFSLPGDNTFWGANFLMLFNRSHDKMEYCFRAKHGI